jgi:hypothetical protein
MAADGSELQRVDIHRARQHQMLHKMQSVFSIRDPILPVFSMFIGPMSS